MYRRKYFFFFLKTVNFKRRTHRRRWIIFEHSCNRFNWCFSVWFSLSLFRIQIGKFEVKKVVGINLRRWWIVNVRNIMIELWKFYTQFNIWRLTAIVCERVNASGVFLSKLLRLIHNWIKTFQMHMVYSLPLLPPLESSNLNF